MQAAQLISLILYLGEGTDAFQARGWTLILSGNAEPCADVSPCIGAWEPFEGLFYLEQEKALGWNEAEEICVCCKAHLASVTSIQIQDMLAAKVAKWSRSIWIGASDQGSEGHWVWADGSPIGFSHWYVGWVLVKKIMLAHHCLTTCCPTSNYISNYQVLLKVHKTVEEGWARQQRQLWDWEGQLRSAGQRQLLVCWHRIFH